ncbi:MAG: radical SAM protein [Promethearchaeota archaeon]
MSNYKPIVERICISVSSKCNLKCKYCYFFDEDKNMPRAPPLTEEEISELLIKIYNYASKQNLVKPLKINFVGGCETLLNWREIANGIRLYQDQVKTRQNYSELSKKIKFYCVTNGILFTDKIAKEMKELKLKPSISIDGPAKIHNAYRVFPNGAPSHHFAMNAIEILKRNNMPVEINTTITHLLMENLDEFFDFVIDNQIDEVIFDRLVDVPKGFPAMSYQEFYEALEKIKNKWEQLNYPFIIGNFKPYFRAIKGNPDRVCTLFGNSCGAGVTAFMYLQRIALPCDRLFNRPFWIIGSIKDEISTILENMQKKFKILENKEIWVRNRKYCANCNIKAECVNDCLIEQSENENYSCKPRKKFIFSMMKMDLDNENIKEYL